MTGVPCVSKWWPSRRALVAMSWPELHESVLHCTPSACSRKSDRSNEPSHFFLPSRSSASCPQCCTSPEPADDGHERAVRTAPPVVVVLTRLVPVPSRLQIVVVLVRPLHHGDCSSPEPRRRQPQMNVPK
eukprot:scaffold107_cov106-Isochrysis_galbana.AAC.17